MSERLINLSPDLKRLREKGADIEIRDGYLAVHSIPYVNSDRRISYGSIVTDLTLNNDRTQPPLNHQVWFTGEYPCKNDGSPVGILQNSDCPQTLTEGLVAKLRFSCMPKGEYANQPKGGYPDYFEKITRYIEIISAHAISLDSSVTPYPHKPILPGSDESIFRYTDTASSRCGISGLGSKCAMNKVAIIGMGGTGSYILDLIAKTHIKEIHLIDGDIFVQHNAFRAPGAASLSILEQGINKACYYAEMYDQMRRGIYAHDVFIDDENLSLLDGADFIFVCVDKPVVRKLVFDYLLENRIPFVDSGMELEFIEESQSLIGACRVTLCTNKKQDHLMRRISTGEAVNDDLYDSNIQVVEMNALNAVLAVLKWKKHCGYYQDLSREHQSTYSVNAHSLTRDEILDVGQ